MASDPPVFITKRTSYAILTAIVVALLLIIGGGVWLGTQVLGLAKDNKTSIRRLNRLTNPTPQQFNEDLKIGIKRCLQSPDCAKLFPAIKTQRKRDKKRTIARLARGVSHLVRYIDAPNSTPTRPTQPVSAPVPGHKKSGHPSNPQQSPPSSPSPTPSPPPPSKPPVNVTAPVPVTVCTHAVGVNC